MTYADVGMKRQHILSLWGENLSGVSPVNVKNLGHIMEKRMNDIVKFCIEECKRQNDYSSESVANMVSAYYELIRLYENGWDIYDHETIILLGKMVIPFNDGYRQTPVTFANGTSGIQWTLIPRQMGLLLDSVGEISPDEFYINFERIHPFEDGNGRVGAILWNFMSGSIENPKCPPNFFEEK